MAKKKLPPSELAKVLSGGVLRVEEQGHEPYDPEVVGPVETQPVADAPDEVYEGVRGLAKYFRIQEQADGSKIFNCKHCRRRWKLQKYGDRHIGNVLHLLNHAYSHGK